MAKYREIASLVGNQSASQAIEIAWIFRGVGQDGDSDPAAVASRHATLGEPAVFGPGKTVDRYRLSLGGPLGSVQTDWVDQLPNGCLRSGPIPQRNLS